MGDILSGWKTLQCNVRTRCADPDDHAHTDLRHRLFGYALVLMIAPLWFGQYLPMVDLPQHAAQIAALKQIWAGNPLFTDVFEINWFTPYLLGYMALYVLSLAMPITVATKIVGICGTRKRSSAYRDLAAHSWR